jgi:hypothetical protein
VLFQRSVLREEEEWGGGSRGAYYSTADLRSVDQWWDELETAAPKFSLYATFLATRADFQTVSCIEVHRSELKEIAGPDCCLVYFRDLAAAERLEQWDYSEHARLVVPIANLIGVAPEQFPCLVFFKRFTAGEFWRVNLRDLPASEWLLRMRQVFSLIRPEAEDPFQTLKQYDWLVFWDRSRDALKDSVKEIVEKSPETYVSLQRGLEGYFYSCFISYSTKDQDFADRLHADLRNVGVRCWLATENLEIGSLFRRRIAEAILLHDKLLVILSDHSVQSDWVREEVESCLEREHREKRSVLFPVRLDDAVMDADEAWAASIRRLRHIGDFTRWRDHDSYQRAFERLLRDLRTAASRRSSATSEEAK